MDVLPQVKGVITTQKMLHNEAYHKILINTFVALIFSLIRAGKISHPLLLRVFHRHGHKYQAIDTRFSDF